MHEEILDFINRRFKENCHWLDGNCYYFAVILKDRFPKGSIWYDVTYGHFMYELNGRFYDWSGEIEPNGKIVPWKIFHLYDKVQYEVIIRDCVRYAMQKMRDCSRCKFCEKDYYYNDELEDEFPLYTCEKGNDTDSDFQCNDFEEFKSTPYVEKYTECDTCEHLSNCKESGIFIETTTIHDITRHFVCDKSKCIKNELPWVEVK